MAVAILTAQLKDAGTNGLPNAKQVPTLQKTIDFDNVAR